MQTAIDLTTTQRDESVRVPAGISSLADFRRWVYSDEFPERGRIDFVDGMIEIDMTPDNIFFHSVPKSELGRVIHNRLKQSRGGYVCVDRTRISNPSTGLSAEPDVVLMSHESIAGGRVRLIPTATPLEGSYIEIEGAPDLVVEVVSDSSVKKDVKRLRRVYFESGIDEYWLADARGPVLTFDILTRGAKEFVPADKDADGYQTSQVLQARYRFERTAGPGGLWEYELHERV